MSEDRDIHCVQVVVQLAFRARCTSPITGNEIVVYGDSIVDAHRRVNLALLREANEHGYEIERASQEEIDGHRASE